jgi:hypothetical protein
MKQLTLGHGISFTTFDIPPDDFEPLKATAATLRRHGFPALPKDPEARLHLEKFFARTKGRLQFIEPEFKILKRAGEKKVPPPPPPPLPDGWCGAIISAPPGDSIKYVAGDFILPRAASPGFSFHWIGIDSNVDLCYAGCESDGGADHGLLIVGWWPSAPVNVSNFPVHLGDYISILICSDEGAGSVAATFYVTNNTSGLLTSFSLQAPEGISLDGQTAQWVSGVDRDADGQALGTLTNFGEVFFSGCFIGTAKNAFLTSSEGNALSFTDPVVCEGVLIAPGIVRTVYIGPQ